ncbi:DNA-binding response regulator [Spongisporangium articulatum]|uniref:DNA-binding response regulator n=1 Tax=Spongisporangium articulatum TaxID=3362603 RepID=A0ABW8AUC9_9ACTN
MATGDPEGARVDTVVAVVEADPSVRDRLAAGLVAAGLAVPVAVADWRLLSGHPHHPPAAVVLSVSSLHGAHPAESIGALRAAGSRVVVRTVSVEVARLRACLAAGAHAFVTTADDAVVVAGAVQAALRGRQYLSPRVAAALRLGGEPVVPAPALSPQEARTLSLYASGLPLKNVARVLGVSYETAKSYLDRVRDKYAAIGRPAGAKAQLRARALEDGHLTE